MNPLLVSLTLGRIAANISRISEGVLLHFAKRDTRKVGADCQVQALKIAPCYLADTTRDRRPNFRLFPRYPLSFPRFHPRFLLFVWPGFLNLPRRRGGTQIGEWTWLKFNIRSAVRKASRGDEDELLRLQTQPNCRAGPTVWIDFNIDFVLELDYYLGTFASSFLRLCTRYLPPLQREKQEKKVVPYSNLRQQKVRYACL